MGQELSIAYSKFMYSELSPDIQVLINHAKEATGYAYAPYSQFHVGCSMRLTDDTIITGSNMENAAYPASICAERVAISHLHAMRYPAPIKAIAIAYHNHRKPTDSHTIAPCGECRQVLLETANRQGQHFDIWLYGSDDNIIHIPAEDLLLPFGFNSAQL